MGSMSPRPHPLVLASIGTVLIDVFDKVQLQPQSKPHNSPGESSSSSRSRTPQIHTTVTPQISLSDSESHSANAPETYEVLGGGALYALVGARIWLSREELRTMVDRRSTSTSSSTDPASGPGALGERPELSPEHEEILRRYGDISIIGADTSGKGKLVLCAGVRPEHHAVEGRAEGEEEGEKGMWIFNESPEKRLARARIRYEGDVRLYQHIVKTPHRTFADLLSSPLRNAQYLHVGPPFSPADLHNLLAEIASTNQSLPRGEAWVPKILFEPTPPSCHAGQREWVEKVYPGIAVFSPNHEELLSLYAHHPVLDSLPDASTVPTRAPGALNHTIPSMPPTLKAHIEALITHILHIGIGPTGDGAIVVRCGRTGSVVGTRKGGIRWFPPFYTPEQEAMVRDVTGAGNAYLGGYAAGLHLSGGDPYRAAMYGTISSAFTVEQIGLPDLQFGDGGEELWNGERAQARLEKFEARLQQ